MTVKAPSSPNIPPPLGIAGQIGVYLVQMAKDVTWFLYQITQRANATLPEDGSERMTGPLPVVQYATASLPSASAYPDSIVWDTTALVMKYSDGTNWITFAGGSSSPASVVYFGSGDPSTLHNNGDLYFDTATTPYTPWVQNSGAWDQYGTVDASDGTYGSVTAVPVITVDSHHRITSVTTAAISSGNLLVAPQGRLTLQSQFSTPNVDQVGKSTIYYDSLYAGNVPIYNGSAWSYLTVTNSEISMGLDAVTPRVAANNLYDIFAINNSGALALCIGPAWSYTGTITTTIATPAVISWTAHGLYEGAPVVFTTTGALPTGITAGTTYFVGKSPGTNSFNISTTVANAAAGTFVATSGSQSGTHTATNGTGGNGLAPARGTGAGTTELQLVNGIWMNKNALTHAWGGASGTTDYGSVAAKCATYLGTFLATANGQTTVHLKPSGTGGGSANIVGLWNAYNRLRGFSYCRDSGGNFGLSANAWKPFNPSGTGSGTNNRITIVDGLAAGYVDASGQTLIFTTANAASSDLGINQNSTTATPTGYATAQTNGTANLSQTLQDRNAFLPVLGVQYIQLMANNGGNTGTGSFNLSGQQNLSAWFDF